MFWEKFKKMCDENNKSPTRVVVELGLSRGSVTNWKKGNLPNPKTIKMIADYFGISILYFFAVPSADQQSAPKLSEQVIQSINDAITEPCEYRLTFEILIPYLRDIVCAFDNVLSDAESLADKMAEHDEQLVTIFNPSYYLDMLQFRTHILNRLRESNSILKIKDLDKYKKIKKELDQIEAAQNHLYFSLLVLQETCKNIADDFVKQAIKNAPERVALNSLIEEAVQEFEQNCEQGSDEE